MSAIASVVLVNLDLADTLGWCEDSGEDSRKTHGGLIDTGGGTQTATDSLVHYGDAAGSNGSYRAFARYLDVNNS